MELEAQGPGEGDASQAPEGTSGRALSTTSHLDGSP